MNSTQLQTTAAPIVAFFAGLLAGKGVFGFSVETWTTLIGGLLGLGGAIWAAFATRQTAMVSTVAAMPEVNKIETTADKAGQELAANTPANVVVK